MSDSKTYTRNNRKESIDTDYKSALAEHAPQNLIERYNMKEIYSSSRIGHCGGIKEAMYINTNNASTDHKEEMCYQMSGTLWLLNN